MTNCYYKTCKYRYIIYTDYIRYYCSYYNGYISYLNGIIDNKDIIQIYPSTKCKYFSEA